MISIGGAFEVLLSTDDRFAALRVGIDLAVLLAFSTKAHDLLRQLMSWGAHANMSGLVFDHEQRLATNPDAGERRGVFDGDPQTLKFVNGLLERLRTLETYKPTFTPPRDELTARECSIVEFISYGRSNKEIARELGIAPETIKSHLKRIFQKLSAKSRAQAVIRAQSLGVLKTVALQPAM